MKLIVTTVVLASLLVTAPVRVTLSAPGHRPKIKTHWNYVVRVTRGGKPVRARITAQIIDPIGGRHPVEFGKSTKKITNWRFKGTFRDFIIWPPESRGIPLKFHVLVVVRKTRHVFNYKVTPHG
jgi:hypothetical protein